MTISRHNAEQAAYFDARRNIRMQPLDTPYIHRHFAEVTRAGGLRPGEAVCEWGAGLGRFSRLLMQAGAELTAIELSVPLANDCRDVLAKVGDVRVEAGDIAEVLGRQRQPFDLMVGFFVLHHLPELELYFRAAAAALKPGGRMAFTEPNPYSPLYPVQLTFTPGMRWKAEMGMYRLYPAQLRQAALNAGFSRVEIKRYGALPRWPYNVLAKVGLERAVERLTLPLFKPFQTIVAWR